MTAQPELFNFRPVGNLTMIEPADRLPAARETGAETLRYIGAGLNPQGRTTGKARPEITCQSESRSTANLSRLADGHKTAPDNDFTGQPIPPPARAFLGCEEDNKSTTATRRQSSSLPPFVRNSQTSRQAAIAKYDAHNSDNQREAILRWIKLRGAQGATREEIADKLGLSGDTVRPRIKELLAEAKGWSTPSLKRSGETRKTKSGLNAEVLIAI